MPRGSALLYLRISGCEILKYRLRRYSLCLGALPLLYPAAPPSVFDYYIVKYTAPAVALGREYVVGFLGLYGRNTIIILKFANHFVNDYVVGISIFVCSIAGTI